jgi:hypothetical protein
MRLPQVAGVLSDATKLGWTDTDQSVAELLFLDASPAGFTDLSGWTEVDSGTNVNISGGVATFNGNGTAIQNGLYWNAAITKQEGYLEYKTKVTGLVGIGLVGYITAVVGLIITRGVNTISNECRATSFQPCFVAQVIGVLAQTYDTYYTVRIYVLKDRVGNVAKSKITIQGGTEFTTETNVAEADSPSTMTFAAGLYFSFNRTTNDADLSYLKDVYWKSGYATDGPYVTYTHDAGAGKTFDTLVLTNLAMPASMASTNLKFDYYFGDDSGGALTGTWRTLAQLNALGTIAGRYRYIKIAVQSNSDGVTQAEIAMPNADTATAGAGDFPATTALLADDTVQGVAGDVALATVLTPRGTFDEAARNTDPGIANVKLDTAYKIQNVALVGTLSAGSLTVPATVTGVAVTNISSTKQRISWNMVAVTGGPAATYELSSDGVTANIATGVVGLNYLRTGLTASTAYSYYVRARNDAGASSAWSTVVTETTDATRAIAASISRDLVTTAATITTANGYNTNVATAEMERQIERNNGRLPMIEVCGPAVNITATKHSGGDMYELEYALVYKANLNDDDLTGSPVTVQTENVAADIIKAIMADHTRGSHAIITRPTDYFHTLDTTGPGMNMFTVVVTFIVETLVDYKNPYLIG